MYGYHLCKFLGVLIRWIIINSLVFFLIRKRNVSFKEVWKGNEIKAPISGMTNEMTNVLLGIIFLIIICTLLYFVRV